MRTLWPFYYRRPKLSDSDFCTRAALREPSHTVAPQCEIGAGARTFDAGARILALRLHFWGWGRQKLTEPSTKTIFDVFKKF